VTESAGPAAVVDASVLVDLLAGTDRAEAARAALGGRALHAPGHLDVEVLSALGRLRRAGFLADGDVEDALRRLESAPITRHDLPALLAHAWALRDDVRLTDALYLVLAARLDVSVLTTDRRLARVSARAEEIA